VKKYVLLLIGCASLIAAGCNDFFLLSKRELKNETFTYTTDALGSYVRYTFDGTGMAGTYEKTRNAYGYATEEDAATGTYAAQSYFPVEGTRGTFTYDPDSYDMSLTITERYELRAGADTGYAADYHWNTLLESEQEHNGSSISSCALNIDLYFVPNSDVPGVSDAQFFSNTFNVPAFNEELLIFADGKPTFKFARTKTIVDNGITTIYSVNIEQIMTISAATIELLKTEINTVKVGSAAASTQTTRTEETYRVENYYIHGKTTGTLDFSAVWKDGNTITFLTERVNAEIVQYSGASEPTTPPSVLQYTGTGENSGVDWSWSINKVPTAQDPITYSHFGDFLMGSDILQHASRRF